ncbi:MAG: hypothetical protein KKE79_09375 [Actinobacteria bacterium]|nr:hypothetical protein [Actinomycetota bacterium]MBU4490826.1 hypothetical protein [Actinomycetota bacterium]MCG2795396.1 hypothetical protein [Actinomycetes bacterium]
MRLKVLPAIGLVLLLLAAGCGEPPSGDSVVKKEVDIRGVVTSVQPADPMGANSDILGLRPNQPPSPNVSFSVISNGLASKVHRPADTI